jgi:hypothetical protein
MSSSRRRELGQRMLQQGFIMPILNLARAMPIIAFS